MTPSLKHPGWQKVIEGLVRKGLTQDQIEAKTGISQSFLSNLKTGSRDDLLFMDGIKLFLLYVEVVLDSRLTLQKHKQ